MKKSLFFIFSVLAMVSARGQVQYHVADVQVMYDVMRRMPNLTGEFLFRNGHSAFSAEINAFPKFYKYSYNQENPESNFEARLAYTYFFREGMKGWGIHAGWDGAFYQAGLYVVDPSASQPYRRFSHELEDFYFIGPEYMYSNSRGTTIEYRLLLGYNLIYACPMAKFKFLWDVPDLFGLTGLSFMGRYTLSLGSYYEFPNDKKDAPWASQGEITLFYNTASLFDGRGAGHYLGRDGLGVFLKLLYTDLHPSGWHSGEDYGDNWESTLTPCIGLRYDF